MDESVCESNRPTPLAIVIVLLTSTIPTPVNLCAITSCFDQRRVTLQIVGECIPEVDTSASRICAISRDMLFSIHSPVVSLHTDYKEDEKSENAL